MFKDIEKYKFVKTHAYKCAKFFDELTMQQKLEFIETCVPYEYGSTYYKIFIHTLLIPNDMYFVSQLITTKDYNKISKYYGLPLGIIIAKVFEIKQYGLDDLLLNQEIDRELASQNIKGLNKVDDLDDILLAVFPDQDYIYKKNNEEQIIKQQIINHVK